MSLHIGPWAIWRDICFGTKCKKVCNFNVRTIASRSKVNPSTNGQYCCPFIFHKMGWTRNETLCQLSKEIWDYLLPEEIMINAEYLPETMNRDTNPQFRAACGASKWKLNPTVFQKISSRWGLPEMDLFAPFFSWKLDSFREGSNAFQVSQEHRKGYAFPPFSLIGRVLNVLRPDYLDSYNSSMTSSNYGI